MIPKIIHYCWFGKKDKDKMIEKNIETWKKFFPDFEIIEWNESNFDINFCKYAKEAYEKKKYAFVSDYVRLYALYNFGGIYFDTDVEAIKGMTKLLKKDKDIYGFELENKIMTGVMISRPKSDIIKEFLNTYQNKVFIKEDNTLDLTPNTQILTELLVKKGISLNNQLQEFSDFIILPIDYLTAFDLKNSCENSTVNTLTIHHYAFSWAAPKKKIITQIKKKLSKILGRDRYNKLRCFIKKK